MAAPRPAATVPPAAEVAAFLAAHPAFLAGNPALYRTLAPPRRVHGEVLADHMAAMLATERAHAAAMADRADAVLAAGRAAAGLAGRVHAAVLALIRSAAPLECVANEFPALLAVDAAALCTEPPAAIGRALPPGSIAALLRHRDAVFRDDPADAVLLHAEAARLARHDALVRVPLPDGPALLVLAARDHPALDPAQGTGALAFLGQALASALSRR